MDALTPSEDWQDNTLANPFWKEVKPVDVMLKSGATSRLTCPKCARGMFWSVIKWRVVEDDASSA